MPKENFFKLSDDKKQRIIDAAYDEFISYSYENTLIRRIAKNAGIAVGSFYLYFEGKDELFIHILDIIQTKINEYKQKNYSINEIFIANKEIELEQILTEKEIKFTNLFYNIPNELIEKILFEHSKDENIKFFEELLNQLKDENSLNEKVDINYLSYILHTISYNTYLYFKSNNMDFDKMDEKINILVEEVLFKGIKKQ